MRTLRSDNNSGLCPEALQAIMHANDGSHAVGYGGDEHSAKAEAAFRHLFGDEVFVRFVATGTAANNLAIASLTEPWQQVIAHQHSHYNEDESTAPERITQCRTVAISSDSSKLTPVDLEKIGRRYHGDVHQAQPGVVTVSNSTEYGEVYQPDEVRALASTAHKLGYRVHIDGARFANAVASIGCRPNELAGGAGVDALSFGGTKNGLALGEAVVFFPQGDGQAFDRAVRCFDYHRKTFGHLLSKHRFISAPFAAVLHDDAWLRHAAHANHMAQRLADGLRARSVPICYPVEANAVFIQLDDAAYQALAAAGHGFYPFGEVDAHMYRLMCSFDTDEAEIERFLQDIDRLSG